MQPIATFSADGTSAIYIVVQGGLFNLFAEGTFGGGTVSFETSASGISWIPLSLGTEDIAWTAPNGIGLVLASELQLRATLSGSTSPDIVIKLGPAS